MTNTFVLCDAWMYQITLSGKARSVYLAIKLHTSAADSTGYPSKRRLSEQCGISVSSVTRALRELEQSGLLETTFRYRKKKKRRTSVQPHRKALSGRQTQAFSRCSAASSRMTRTPTGNP